jgi:hypothetical protein
MTDRPAVSPKYYHFATITILKTHITCVFALISRRGGNSIYVTGDESKSVRRHFAILAGQPSQNGYTASKERCTIKIGPAVFLVGDGFPSKFFRVVRVEIIAHWITFDSGSFIRPKKISDYHTFNGWINVQLIPKLIPAPILNRIRQFGSRITLWNNVHSICLSVGIPCRFLRCNESDFHQWYPSTIFGAISHPPF